MKIDRLIGILSILLQRNKITTAELAGKFEVSRRTILRDIESLNRAGIPIVTSQGQGGGISIIENFKIDKTVLSSDEMQSIISGLRSLDSVSETKHYRQLMDKLSSKSSYSINTDDHIIIDLSMWDKSAVSEKIELIKSAIENNEKISFTYYSPNGISIREIEPYHLVFQWSSWYVWGFCTERNNYRMFKLTRLTNLKCTYKKFEKKEIPNYVCDKLRHTRGSTEAVVKFDKHAKWRIIDEWGTNNFDEDKDGNIIIKLTWSNKQSLFNWILSFAGQAEIISPDEYRKEFRKMIINILEKY